MTQYDFDQLVAEAVERIGQSLGKTWLTHVARDSGWPIPAVQRLKVVRELAVFVQLTELARA